MNKFIGLSSIIAGVLHSTLVAMGHWFIPPIEGLFFIVTGLLQIFWGWNLLKEESNKNLARVIEINGLLIGLWAFTRILPAPFMDGPEHIAALDVIVQLFQLGALFGAVHLLFKNDSKFNYIALLAFGSLLAGGGVYAGGKAMEPMFPDRIVDHHHAEDEHPHMMEGDMDHHDDKEMMNKESMEEGETHDKEIEKQKEMMGDVMEKDEGSDEMKQKMMKDKSDDGHGHGH